MHFMLLPDPRNYLKTLRNSENYKLSTNYLQTYIVKIFSVVLLEIVVEQIAIHVISHVDDLVSSPQHFN